MKWFKKSSSAKPAPDRVVEVIPTNVEDKRAFKKAKAQADEVNQKLNDQLLSNGFTIKIYIATGGKQHGGQKT